MEFDAFTARLGIGQGRIDMDGQTVFVLGDVEPGWHRTLAVGDYAEVAQQVDLTDIEIVRASLTLHVRAGIPAGLAWEVSITVDGAKAGRVLGWPGRTRTITDLGANVSKLTGQHTVAVRLELVEA